MNKKICFVKQRINYGGASKITIWLFNYLLSRSYDVSIITFEPFDSTSFNIPGERCYCIDIDNNGGYIKRNILSIYKKYKALSTMLKKQGITYVINFCDTSFDILLLVRLFYKFKLIISERVDPYHDRGVVSRFRRYLYRYADHIVFQTAGAKGFFKSSVIKKSCVIPNPVVPPKIEFARWHGIMSNHLVFIGRLDNFQKRLDLLIDIFELFHDKYPEYILDIYGTGPDSQLVSKMIEDRGLMSSVFLRGDTQSPLLVMSESKVLLHTSDFEGIPNVIIEAIQVGIPVVSTDCSPGGASLLIRNGINGFLVECNNKEAFCNVLIDLVSNEEMLSNISNNCNGSLNSFTEDKIGALWADIIDSL